MKNIVMSFLISNKYPTHNLLLLVFLLQKSNKRDLSLSVNMEKSCVLQNRLKLHHNDRDYDNIIRAYIDTVLCKSITIIMHTFLYILVALIIVIYLILSYI